MKLIGDESAERIDKFICLNSDLSRNKVIEMIDNELIKVNDKVVKKSYKVMPGDDIYIKDNYIKEITLEKEDIPLDIMYEDDYIIVVNKPSGMVVHPGSGNSNHTLVNALLNHTDKLSKQDVRPGIVHRIDKDTSGVLLIAKTDEALNILAEGFKNKTIKREYIALLKGEYPNANAIIDAPIGRDPRDRKKMTVTSKNSKNAVTHLKVIKRYPGFTLVSLRLETGRTHQIRVHMKYIGYPVYNDPVYTKDKCTEFGQFLHAKSLEFNHPITNEKMYFEAKLPEEFQNFIDNLDKMSNLS